MHPTNPDERSHLPEPSAELDQLAHDVIGAAIEVHRILGPGYLESVYEEALCFELGARGIPFARQEPISLTYKGTVVGDVRMDLVVAGRLVIELKSVNALAPVHVAQLLSCLKGTGLPLGLLMNFNVPVLREGIRRIIRTTTTSAPK
jgi:GxxExxY protein